VTELIVIIVVVVVLAALLVWWWTARRRTAPGRVLDHQPDSSWDDRPRPGEIWIADVPFQDRRGSKVRPCLVIRVHPSYVDVLKITSQDKSSRADHVEIETRSWDPEATHNSFLDTSAPIRVGDMSLERCVGRLHDKAALSRVKRQHALGWVGR
jgi:PemK-like, MazF-like toxin of type II toxin-antitoxin system